MFSINFVRSFVFVNQSIICVLAWNHIRSSSDLPDVAGHTLTATSNTTLYLIGGYSGTNQFNEVWLIC